MSEHLFSDMSGPATGIEAVAKSDTVGMAKKTRGLYVGTGGDVVVVPAFNSTAPVTFKNVPSGTVLPVVAQRVNATGTTATDIVALY